MTLRRGLFVLALILVTAGIAAAQSANWFKFVAPDGSFSVSLPITPKAVTQTKDNPVGQIITNIWLANVDSGLYAVGVTDYPVDVNTQKELDADRDNFLKAVDAKLVSESDFIFASNGTGYPSKEFTGVSTDGAYTYKSRIFVVSSRRVYQIVAREETATLNIERVNNFLLSFIFN
jgi:hypothetical protein